jgi:hypothetical protein
MPALPDDASATPHYWSYRALLEDKKRCLTDIPHVKHDQCNSLLREGEDFHKSQRAMEERIRHLGMSMATNWDPNGRRTPPHEFTTDKNQPHYSYKELCEEKKRMQTSMRERERRPSQSPPPGATRPASAPSEKSEGDLEAPTMNQLMKPGKRMGTGVETERVALQENRPSTVPHNSYELLNMKKRFHATKIHQKPRRAQSARELGSYSSTPPGTPPDSEADFRRDPTIKSYQGDYPYGNSSEAWPEGRADPKKTGRYRSQAYFSIDKRRHAARVDGDRNQEEALLREVYQDQDLDGQRDEQGWLKPDFTARYDKYKSQYALTQHKKRHLATIHTDGDESAYIPRSPYSDSTVKQDLFTSHKSLEYGKRGHVVGLGSTAKRRVKSADGDTSSVGSSSCDVGKGISSMMHKHRDKNVHTSQVEFSLKKKNHATAVMRRPLPEGERGDRTDLDSNCGADVLMETRRPSNPHNSCKAFALKKKYHQTSVHVKAQSRLAPAATREKPLNKHPNVLYSQGELNKLKKLHSFEYDPDERKKPGSRPVPNAPVPRNGQWTPQHILD